MKLRLEFEATRSNVMNRDPSPSLDVCFGELIREEQRLATQATYQQDKMTSNAVAYTAHGKGKGRDMRKVQCLSCKEYGHIAARCSKKSCNYCKKPRHIIKEYGLVDDYVSLFCLRAPRSVCGPPWAVGPLHRSKNAKMHTVRNGIADSLRDFSPTLRPITLDQVSGKILAKGPKVGSLFPLYFSIPSLSLACMTVHSQSEVWHKRLGHPNFVVLSHMFNSGLLGNKEQVFKNLSFDCSVCKLGKSKTLLFPSHGSRAAKCFDIVHSDSLPEISILPCYDELPPFPERFKPGIVYSRCLPNLPPLKIDPSSAPNPTPSTPVPISSPEPDMSPASSPR
ncbi:hypothetical protein HHK36_011538 [Tetracentron sinense]|uniref:GAG-pre-integrase domain-containing protein n=1 Tax=Tetracentron sinense TaxID=13715 RepID=A0A834Z8H2_TETSI|nr:hypothetical protein HHK36_011538 [Tetracentron sinense]